MTPRSLTAQLDQHCYRSSRPNLVFRIWWKSRRAERHEPGRVVGRGAHDAVALGQLAQVAAVDRQRGRPVAARPRGAPRSSGSSTRVRSKSMCGDTGVSSRARWRGRDDRATGREGVGGRAGGRGHDQPVGGVGREERAVELHPQPHGVAHRGLLEHRLVERDRAVRTGLTVGRLHPDGQQHPLLDLGFARQPAARALAPSRRARPR